MTFSSISQNYKKLNTYNVIIQYRMEFYRISALDIFTYELLSISTIQYKLFEIFVNRQINPQCRCTYFNIQHNNNNNKIMYEINHHPFQIKSTK